MILVGDKYKIDADKLQYILLSARDAKAEVDGVEVDVVRWDKTYHASIEQCAKAIVDKEMKKSVMEGVMFPFSAAVERLASAISRAK